MTEIDATDQGLDRAVDLIHAGQVVAFPTETVYGLGADATNGEAVAKIFAIKGRPQFNPLISHFSRASDISSHVDMTPLAEELIAHFCPGPLTLILKRKEQSTISDLVTAGLDTMAVRVPSHPVACGFIAKTGVPIAAPSANVSGALSPTTAMHVKQSLDGKVPLVLAGGKAKTGLESTIVDACGEKPVILRLGGITTSDMAKALGIDENNISVSLGRKDEAPQSPGQLLKHYAPSKPLRLNVTLAEKEESLLAFGPIPIGQAFLNLSEKGDLYEAAANLFAMLHEMDGDEAVKRIAVMPIPDEGMGIAINDRLIRAARP